MTGNELIKLLVKNGWKLDKIKGSHHIMIKERKTLVVPVHGKKDIPKGTLFVLLKRGDLK